MAIRNRLPTVEGVRRYEQISILGIVLTILGAFTGWLTVTASEEAAAELDDVEPGTTVFTGSDLAWGDITLLLAIIAVVILALVLWRYGAAGRITGLVTMLLGLVIGAVALVGIVLTGLIFAPAEDFADVSVDLGFGILLTLLGALLILSGGILRLAAGSPTVEDA